ncbi:MAG TPA: response regulator transcription factor [Candidatus Eremiobacteraceae bacterium]|nr:response regulator transcription factor [Candidatus Eremiobacteraceae bacterium]
MKILIVEDDKRLASVVRRGLVESGHVVDIESDGDAGLAAARQSSYDAVLLDVMLPGTDGLSIARTLRAERIKTPILMLTARDAMDDRVAGLDSGADDYLCKPFGFAELEARLRAITRREPNIPRQELRVADLVMDLGSRRTWRGKREIYLTARETAFLEYLMRNEGLLITRAMLEDALWERDRSTASNLIEVYVRRLRAKLCAAGEAPLIHTVRGSGYRISASGDGADDATL